MRRAWRDGPNKNCLPPSNKWRGQMVKSYDSAATGKLCHREPKGLGHKRVAFTVRLQHACAQVNESELPLVTWYCGTYLDLQRFQDWAY